ncbi:LytTR family transcriptional regulator DNA-binding domain-containing protein [Brevundimonas sp. SL161]|uniref:LytTR family DNA-binding domain-containing protein n=1 Tax=Brevundimonas sp. SL161 TaxID=2804613 RepID=UPI003CF0A200
MTSPARRPVAAASPVSRTGERVRDTANGSASAGHRYSRAMNETPTRSMNTPRAWMIDLAAWAVVGAILGAVGPFGSFFNDTLPVRLAYWMTLALISGAVIGASVRWVWPVARRRRVPAWAWVALLGVAITGPLGLFARVFAMGFWPGIRDRVSLIEWFGQTLLIELVFLAAYVAAHARAAQAPSGETSPMPTGAARILDRLPHRLGRDLLCLQMEDHYVRLHTPEGSVLGLTPLRTAITQVGAIEGMQVHRSWWVARQAVQGVVQDGRNLRLKLVSGLEAPVARSKVAELRAAGWPVGEA